MGNNSLIYKNTIILYLRIAFVMLVGLYSSRILLQALGADDFGVYNVVGSTVLLFGAIKGLFISSTQRFLNFHMGKADLVGLQKVFNVSVNIHWILCGVFVLVAEPVGIWFINCKMSYPSELTWVIHAIYQMSIISAVAAIMAAPYDAVIIANQKMNVYAIFSLSETILKLGAAFLIYYLSSNKLFIYGVVIMIISLLVRSMSRFYCKRYSYCQRVAVKDKTLYKDMGKFAGWNFLGNMAFSLSNEGQNMLLNVYFGPAVNAARAIAYQVRNAFYQLTSNLDLAFAPRLTHLYAQENKAELTSLASLALRLSVAIIIIVCLPIFFYIDDILALWLTNVPSYTSSIVQCLMVMIVLKPYATINDTLFRASGDLKKYQLISSCITLSSFIGSLIYLYFNHSLLAVFWIYNLFCLVNVVSTYILLYLRGIIFNKQYIRISLVNGMLPTVILLGLGWLYTKYPLFNLWIFNLISLGVIDLLYMAIFHTSIKEKRNFISLIKHHYAR